MKFEEEELVKRNLNIYTQLLQKHTIEFLYLQE